MKFLVLLFALAAFVASSATSAQVRGGSDVIEQADAHQDANKRNLDADDTVCKGQTLSRGEKLYPGESICGLINNEMIYYGVRAYPNQPIEGYTRYRPVVWSQYYTIYKEFGSIGIPSDSPAPFLQLQGDGNVVFAGQGTGCLAKPGKRGSNISMSIEGPFPDLVKVRDHDGDISWKIGWTETITRIGGSICYPETPPRCVSALKERERLAWNEYICEFDSNGNRIAHFGLDSYGLLALWRNNSLVWRPGPYHVRGDYLHLQGDGHLTLYRATEPDLTYNFVSGCLGKGSSKIVVVDGDVLHLNGDGSMNWALGGEEPVAPTCFPGCGL